MQLTAVLSLALAAGLAEEGAAAQGEGQQPLALALEQPLEQPMEEDTTSLLQLRLDLSTPDVVDFRSRQRTLYRGTQPVIPPHAPWSANISSFVSRDGLLCFEGPPLEVEGSLGLKKAGITGRLYDNVTARAGPCAGRGYTHSGGPDGCYMDTQVFSSGPADAADAALREAEQLETFGLEYNLPLETVGLMADCTCQLGSPRRAQRGAACAQLDTIPGAWVHHDHETGQEVAICDSGPFTTITWALAALKTNPQMPMHMHDRIKATTCAALGYGVPLSLNDHCFPPIQCYSNCTDIYHCQGVDDSMRVEHALYDGTAAADYFIREGMNVEVLMSRSGCQCLENSEVYQIIGPGACDGPGALPPIRHWWHTAVEDQQNPLR